MLFFLQMFDESQPGPVKKCNVSSEMDNWTSSIHYIENRNILVPILKAKCVIYYPGYC